MWTFCWYFFRSQRWLDALDDDLRASRYHPDRNMIEQNHATDQEEPSQLLSRTRAEEGTEEEPVGKKRRIAI